MRLHPFPARPLPDTLLPWQRDAIHSVHAHLTEGAKRVLGVASTGLGKSVFAANLARALDARTLIIAHREELIDQLAETVHKWWPETSVGKVMAHHHEPDANVVVATVQTLINRLDRVPGPFDLIIHDEVHHGLAKSHLAVLDHYCGTADLLPGMPPPDWAPVVVGITATPDRTDRKGVAEWFWHRIAFSHDVRWAIEHGYLCDLLTLTVQLDGLDLDNVEQRHGDYADGALGRALQSAGAPKLILEAWQRHGENRQTMIFSPTVAMSRAVADAFTDAGIAAEHMDGGARRDDRRDCLARFRAGQTKVLSNVALFVEGLDVPEVACVDEETEILTPGGWRGIDDEFTEIVGIDADGRLAVAAVEERVSGECNSWIDGRAGRYSFSFTPNHRVLAGTGRRETPAEFRDASDLPSLERFRLPTSATTFDRADADISDDDLRFVAWFMTDGGWLGRKDAIRISQSKPPTVARIRELLTRCGFRFREYVRSNVRGVGGESAMPIHAFDIPKGNKLPGDLRGKGYERLSPWLDKSGASGLLRLSRRQFDLFWSELLLGDGNGDKRRAPQLCVADKALLGTLQAAACMAGYSTNASWKILPSGKKFWMMWIGERRHIEIKPNDKRRAEPQVYETRDARRFWCVQSRLGTIVVRRDGFVHITGNCVVLARPTKSRVVYSQAVGRGLRLAPGKENCIVIDIAGATKDNKLVQAHDLLGLHRALERHESAKAAMQREAAEAADAEERAAQRKAEEDDTDWQHGTARFANVDAFGRPAGMRHRWLHAPMSGCVDRWTHDTGDWRVVFRRGNTETRTWLAGAFKPDDRATEPVHICESTSFVATTEAAEAWIDGNRAPDAWKRDAPSQAQLYALRRAGWTGDPATLTKAKAGALIGQHKAQERRARDLQREANEAAQITIPRVAAAIGGRRMIAPGDVPSMLGIPTTELSTDTARRTLAAMHAKGMLRPQGESYVVVSTATEVAS